MVNKIPGVFDSTRVAIGSPNRAGMYLVTAITSNPNYKTGVGTGTLVVKMRATGANLVWNSDQTTFTTDELTKLGATLMRGEQAAHNQDGVHYRYVGTTDTHRLYISARRPPSPAHTARPLTSSAATTWQSPSPAASRSRQTKAPQNTKTPGAAAPGRFFVSIWAQWLSAMR